MSGGAQQTLGIVLTMDASGVVQGANLADAAFQRVEQSAQRSASTIDAHGKQMNHSMAFAGAAATAGMATLGVGHALKAKVLNPMMEDAKEFETKFEDLKFATGAVGPELERLQRSVIETGIKTQFDPSEATEALYELKSAGMSTDLALETLNSTLDLATASAGQLGLGEAARTTAMAMMKLQGTGDSARQMVDKMAASTRVSGIHWRDMPIMLNSVGAATSILNLKTESLLGSLGAMATMQMMPAQAGNTIMGTARRLLIVQKQVDRVTEKFGSMADVPLKKMPQVVKSFQKFGVSIFDAQGKMRPFEQIMADAVRAESKFGTQQEFSIASMDMFGTQAMSLIQSIKNLKFEGKTGADAYLALVENIGKGAGAAREAAAGIEGTSRGQEKFLKGSMQAINIVMGTTMKKIFTPMKQSAIDVANAFLAWQQNNPALAASLGTVLVVVTGLITAVGTYMMWLAGVAMWSMHVGPAIAHMGGMAKMASMGFKAMSASLIPVAIALAAVGAVWYAYKTNLWGFQTFANEFLGDITGVFSSVYEILQGREVALGPQWKGMSDGAKEFVFALIELKNRAVDFGRGFLKGVKAPLSMLFGAFMFLVFAVGMLAKGLNWVISSLTRSGASSKAAKSGFSSLGTVVGLLAGSYIVAKVAMMAYAGVMAIVTGIGKAYTAVVKGITAAQWLWNAAMVANPFILIVAGIVILIIAILLLIVYWDEVCAYFGPIFAETWEGLKLIWNDIGAWFDQTMIEFGEGLVLIWTDITTGIENAVNTLADIIAYPFIEAGVWVVEVVTSIGDALSAAWDWIASGAASGWSYIGSAIWSGIMWIWEAITGVGSALYDAGSNVISALWDGMKAVWAQLVAWFEQGVQYIQNLWPFSRAKEGPWHAKTPEQAGGNVVKYLTQGAESQMPALQQTFVQGAQDISTVLDPAAPGGPLTGYDLQTATLMGGGMFGGPMSVPGTDVMAPAGGAYGAVDPMARIEQLMTEMAAAQATPAPSEKNIVITIGDTSVQVLQATDEEAERLAKMVTIKIKAELQNLMDSEFD